MPVVSSRFMLAFLAAAAAVARAEVSPDGSCGLSGAGEEKGYTCPGDVQCCGATGWCGTSEAHCLTTVGCQADYSNSTAACTEPVPGTTISPDGTCGTEGAGEYGYVCPEEGFTCCSASGYCGDTADHCAADSGCQADYGTCQ